MNIQLMVGTDLRGYFTGVDGVRLKTLETRNVFPWDTNVSVAPATNWETGKFAIITITPANAKEMNFAEEEQVSVMTNTILECKGSSSKVVNDSTKTLSQMQADVKGTIKSGQAVAFYTKNNDGDGATIAVFNKNPTGGADTWITLTNHERAAKAPVVVLPKGGTVVALTHKDTGIAPTAVNDITELEARIADIKKEIAGGSIDDLVAAGIEIPTGSNPDGSTKVETVVGEADVIAKLDAFLARLKTTSGYPMSPTSAEETIAILQSMKDHKADITFPIDLPAEGLAPIDPTIGITGPTTQKIAGPSLTPAQIQDVMSRGGTVKYNFHKAGVDSTPQTWAAAPNLADGIENPDGSFWILSKDGKLLKLDKDGKKTADAPIQAVHTSYARQLMRLKDGHLAVFYGDNYGLDYHVAVLDSSGTVIRTVKVDGRFNGLALALPGGEWAIGQAIYNPDLTLKRKVNFPSSFREGTAVGVTTTGHILYMGFHTNPEYAWSDLSGTITVNPTKTANPDGTHRGPVVQNADGTLSQGYYKMQIWKDNGDIISSSDTITSQTSICMIRVPNGNLLVGGGETTYSPSTQHSSTITTDSHGTYMGPPSRDYGVGYIQRLVLAKSKKILAVGEKATTILDLDANDGKGRPLIGIPIRTTFSKGSGSLRIMKLRSGDILIPGTGTVFDPDTGLVKWRGTPRPTDKTIGSPTDFVENKDGTFLAWSGYSSIIHLDSKLGEVTGAYQPDYGIGYISALTPLTNGNWLVIGKKGLIIVDKTGAVVPGTKQTGGNAYYPVPFAVSKTTGNIAVFADGKLTVFNNVGTIISPSSAITGVRSANHIIPNKDGTFLLISGTEAFKLDATGTLVGSAVTIPENFYKYVVNKDGSILAVGGSKTFVLDSSGASSNVLTAPGSAYPFQREDGNILMRPAASYQKEAWVVDPTGKIIVKPFIDPFFTESASAGNLLRTSGNRFVYLEHEGYDSVRFINDDGTTIWIGILKETFEYKKKPDGTYAWFDDKGVEKTNTVTAGTPPVTTVTPWTPPTTLTKKTSMTVDFPTDDWKGTVFLDKSVTSANFDTRIDEMIKFLQDGPAIWENVKKLFPAGLPLWGKPYAGNPITIQTPTAPGVTQPVTFAASRLPAPFPFNMVAYEQHSAFSLVKGTGHKKGWRFYHGSGALPTLANTWMNGVKVASDADLQSLVATYLKIGGGNVIYVNGNTVTTNITTSSLSTGQLNTSNKYIQIIDEDAL